MTRYSYTEKIAAIRRELAFRHKVFPARVKAGWMAQTEADRQIGIFEEMIEDYTALEYAQQLPLGDR